MAREGMSVGEDGMKKIPSRVIEMGELNGDGCNFKYASLELKSECERMN